MLRKLVKPKRPTKISQTRSLGFSEPWYFTHY